MKKFKYIFLLFVIYGCTNNEIKNNNASLIEQINTYIIGDSCSVLEKSEVFDLKGNLVQTFYYNDTFNFNLTFKYDQENDLMESYRYFSKKKLRLSLFQILKKC